MKPINMTEEQIRNISDELFRQASEENPRDLDVSDERYEDLLIERLPTEAQKAILAKIEENMSKPIHGEYHISAGWWQELRQQLGD